MKIWIAGGVAHGKSTFSQMIAREFDIPLLELDNVVYKDNFGNRYEEEEIRRNIKTFLVRNKRWIIEGAQKREWCEEAFSQADVVLILKINRWVALKRFLRRHFERFLEGNHQRGKFITKIKWIYFYERDDFPQYINLLKKHRRFYLIIQNQKQSDEAIVYLRSLK